ncbi:MAG: hypothetical protein ABNH26_01195 [Celeribacter sp.]
MSSFTDPAPSPDAPLLDAAGAAVSLLGSGIKRQVRVPEVARPPEFDAQYDADTLWYDAVRQGDEVWLFCPKLWDLARLLKRGEITADGLPVRLRGIGRHRRHDVARLDVPHTARSLHIAAEGWSASCPISPDQRDLFAGLNASMHISRDNRLEWIVDWARWHKARHGLQAMVVIDNGSTSYQPADVLAALAPVGLTRAAVLSLPQPYGPVRSKQGGGGAKFLQPAALNIVRARFLGRARAVLNADIDELVWSEGGSVFDAAVASWLGMVSFAGRWTCPPGEAQPPLRHADHVCYRDDRPCPTKYCIVPQGPLRRLSWDVHRPERFPLGRFTRRDDMGYFHCRGVTTNWKSYNRLKSRDVRPDPHLEKMLAQTYG